MGRIGVLCIVWAPFSPRLDELCAELNPEFGASRVTLSFLYGHRKLAPLRYLVLAIETGLLLLRKRPLAVYAQNPPIFCPLACLPYCKIFRRPLLIDHHAVWSTKTLGQGFLGRAIRKIEGYASSRAFVNTTPHDLWTREISDLGARNATTIHDYVAKRKVARDAEFHDKLSKGRKILILAPHGGHPLERIENEVEACSRLEDSFILISGPPNKLAMRVGRINFPENARYAGFLESEDYEKAKASADLGLCITDEPHTISHSLLEFAAYSTPVVSSKQKPVEMMFGDSIAYVDSSNPEDIYKVLKELFEEPGKLRDLSEKIARKQEEISLERKKAMSKFLELVASSLRD